MEVWLSTCSLSVSRAIRIWKLSMIMRQCFTMDAGMTFQAHHAMVDATCSNGANMVGAHMNQWLMQACSYGATWLVQK
eukprot:scaffold269379_cov23-Tisochrysis_lutea.AAC.1